MTKDAISDYSATAGSNTDVGGVNVNEGCPPSGINNAIRELMSHLADLNAGSSSLGTIKVDNLQLDANAITSTNTNGDIAITPNGTGDVVIDGLKHPQADGTANHFLKTDGAAQLSFAQVDTASIADNAVTLAKMASGTDGNIISYDASGNPVAVATGTAGQILTSAGAGAPPTFADAAGGGLTSVAVSGTTPTLDWSAGNVFTQTLSGNTTFSFSNVPSGASSIELLLNNVGKTNDYLSMRNGTGEAVGDTIGAQKQPHNITFNADGSKFYLSEFLDSLVYQFSLSTNYDISTASYDSKVSPNGRNNYEIMAGFNADGTKLISGTGSNITEHTLSSAYDISTISGTANHTVSVTTFFTTNYDSGTPEISNLRFNSDGTKLAIFSGKHLGDTNNNTIPAVAVISLSAAYDIDSTLTLFSQFDPYMDTNVSLTGDISPDGRYLVFYTSDNTASVHFGGTSAQVGYQVFYNESGGFDVSKAKGGGHNRLHNLVLGSEPPSAFRVLGISDDGKFLYTHEKMASSNFNPFIRQYNLSGGHQVTMPSSVTSLPSDFGNGDDPNTVTYLKLMTVNGGTNVYITDHKEILA